MRCEIHCEPSDVHTWTGVDCNCAEEGRKILDAVVMDSEQNNVACYAKEIGKEYELRRINNLLGGASRGIRGSKLTGPRVRVLSENHAKTRKQIPPKIYTGIVRYCTANPSWPIASIIEGRNVLNP